MLYKVTAKVLLAVPIVDSQCLMMRVQLLPHSHSCSVSVHHINTAVALFFFATPLYTTRCTHASAHECIFTY